MNDRPPIGQTEGKKSQVTEMFDAIADRYDLLNRVLSLGIDQYWRRQAVDWLLDDNPGRLLDVATGTADLALLMLDLEPEEVIGVDLSAAMLERGRAKLRQQDVSDRISLCQGDSEDLPFEDESFDAAAVAFGVRNFENLHRGLSEIGRVLRPGGALVVLEFSRPRTAPIKQLYSFYLHYILPRIGGLIASRPDAYRYLPDSVAIFPDGEEFLAEMEESGFHAVEWRPLMFGIASLYKGYV
jgi:demethylmenaquinone methyltransferase/2-methoxy-6-polyprenyl-1,4-benzoquinol methylase